MKNTYKLAALLSLALATPSIADDIPTGSLIVGDNVDAVTEGSRPQLSWSINFPGPPVDETLTTTTETQLDVQMLGTSVVVRRDKRITNTEMKFSNQGSWTHVFQGIDTDVNVDEILISELLPEGTTIEFRTQREDGNGQLDEWRYFEPSNTDNNHVKVLRDGSELPWVGTPNNQRDIGDFLSGYVNQAGTHVVLDDNQVIMAVEMSNRSPEESGYDLQDVIVLLTFTETEEGK